MSTKKDPISSLKMYERLAEEFGFAVVPFTGTYRIGEICDQLWGSFADGQYKVIGFSTRAIWHRHAKFTNRRWKCFVRAHEMAAPGYRFMKVVKVTKP